MSATPYGELALEEVDDLYGNGYIIRIPWLDDAVRLGPTSFGPSQDKPKNTARGSYTYQFASTMV